MPRPPSSFFSLVPSDSPHEVEGDREVMLAGMSLEILATRKINLQKWNLKNLSDPYWRLYCPTEGSATVEFEGTTHKLSPDNIYLIPPRTKLTTSNPVPFSKWYVHFVLGRIDTLSVPGIYSQPTDETIKGHLEAIGCESESPCSWRSAQLVLHALTQLTSEAWTDRRLDPRVERAMDYFQSNLATKISAEEAAKAAGVSVRNLNHLFKTQARIAPMGALLNFRLDRACYLLRHTEQTIEQVAENCGFPNRYYFSRMLKKHRGISPAAYRKGQLY